MVGNLRLGVIWTGAFVYSCLVSGTIQLVLLPYVFPQWNGGDGLLIAHDWLYFHRLAVEYARNVQLGGWSQWSVGCEPNAVAECGFASAIYAATGILKPWVLIPFNAAIHATGAFVLALCMSFFVPSRKILFWSVLPFVLFPTALSWVTQLHKDGVSILGGFLFLLGWMSMNRSIVIPRGQWRTLYFALLLTLGAALSGVVRPYLGHAFLVSGGTIGFIVLASAWKRMTRPQWGSFAFGVLIIGGVIATLFWVKNMSYLSGYGRTEDAAPALFIVESPKESATDGSAQKSDVKPGVGQTNAVVVTDSEQGYETVVTKESPRVWQRSRFLPPRFEHIFYVISNRRDGYLGYKEHKSVIDSDVHFRKWTDVIAYIPRATQVALLAPFPQHWTAQGSTSATTVLRKVVGVEMLFIYFMLPFWAWGVWRYRTRIECWILQAFCFTFLLTYAIVVPNLGALHRFRYGFITPLIAFAIVCVADALVWARTLRIWKLRATKGLPA